MRPYFLEWYGNPSSHIHEQGQKALRAVDQARAEVAALIGAKAGEIVFTSGATESNNLAVLGAAEGAGAGKRHVVVTDVEHFSVTNALIPLRNAGYEVTVLPVDRNGVVDPDAVRKALRADTALLSVMHANSEIGTIEPVGPIGRIAKEAGVTFHVDATASAGHIPVDVREIPADLVTLSAHNFYGPKGAGALYLREGRRWRRGRSAGSRRWGIGPARKMFPPWWGWAWRRPSRGGRWGRGRRISHSWGRRCGAASRRSPCSITPGTLPNVFPGTSPSGWSMSRGVPSPVPRHEGIMAASGSACSSNLRGHDEEDLVASPVLRAIGVPSDICTGSITFSLGKGNTADEVRLALDALPGIVERLRAMSPTYLDYQKQHVKGG